MADNDSNRQLPASERKIANARRDGQVARSRDLGHLAAIGVGCALLLPLAAQAVDSLRRLLAGALRFDAAAARDGARMAEALMQAATLAAALLAPLAVAMILAALAAALLGGGWNFTLKPLQPRFDKLDPLSGLGRIVSRHQLGETLKACLLAAVLLGVGGLYLRRHLAEFTQLAQGPLDRSLDVAGTLLADGVQPLLVALALFALVDVPLQRKLLLNRLRMSHDEAKKEHKEVEGNVEVKARIRQRMRQLASRRMLAAVPEADLVVMNPTHYAVALKYDERSMAAPRVVAKGSDLLAMKIRDLARESRVPVLQAPPLARALFAHCEVDQEVPAVLFSAVAQVLAWVYQLRRAALGTELPPPAVVVPPDLDPANGVRKLRRGRRSEQP